MLNTIPHNPYMKPVQGSLLVLFSLFVMIGLAACSDSRLNQYSYYQIYLDDGADVDENVEALAAMPGVTVLSSNQEERYIFIQQDNTIPNPQSIAGFGRVQEISCPGHELCPED